ncbi:hypothetical protein HZB01_05195, partial [Candidatus Woesearchaeota archaeon]|nr:hypothetical protein [Candidatus Woesearchaeota archaeon]
MKNSCKVWGILFLICLSIVLFLSLPIAKGIEAGDKTRITTLTVHFGEKQVYAGLLGEADAYDAVKGLKVIEDSGLQIGEYLPELPASYRLKLVRISGKGYDLFREQDLIRATLSRSTPLF